MSTFLSDAAVFVHDHFVLVIFVLFCVCAVFVMRRVYWKRQVNEQKKKRVVSFDDNVHVDNGVRARPEQQSIGTIYSDMCHIVYDHSERFNVLCTKLKDAGPVVFNEYPVTLNLYCSDFNSFAQYSRFDVDKFVAKSERVREWYNRYAVNIKKRGRISSQLPRFSSVRDVEENLFVWGAKGDAHILSRLYLSIEAKECARLLWDGFDPKQAVVVHVGYKTPAGRKSYSDIRTYSLGDLERVLDKAVVAAEKKHVKQGRHELSDYDIGIVANPVLVHPDGTCETAVPDDVPRRVPDLNIPTVPPKIDVQTSNNGVVNNIYQSAVENILQHAESQKFVAPVTHGAQMLHRSGVLVSEQPKYDINDLILRDEAKHAASEKQVYHPVSLEQKLVPDDVLTRSLDGMDGPEFEKFCADLLRYVGFTQVSMTPHHNDYGVDIVAYWGDDKWLVQCKSYSSRLGNKPVQEVVGGKGVYKGDKLAVMTNSSFTKNAKVVAAASHVALWNGAVLRQMQLGKFNIGVYYR